MPLTEKEKRIITSPLSFSSKKRKTTKFRTRKKIQEILCDVRFLIENHFKVYDGFGIDVLENVVISEHFSESKENDKDTIHDKPSNDKPSNDPDLL